MSKPELALDSTNLSRRAAPGPRAWPVLGDPGALRASSNLLQYVEGHWQRYGDVFRVRMLGASLLVIAHPDAIKHVLWSKRQNYVKGKAYDGVRRVLGAGLVTLEGDAWKERRTLAQPAFHRRSLEKLTAFMVDSGARYFNGLLTRARGGSIEIDAVTEMTKLTLDVVVNALFGQALDDAKVPYEALSHALELMSQGSNTVVLPAWVPTPHNLKLNRTLAELDRIVFDIINHARKAERDDGSLLSMLLTARDEQGAPLDDRAIRDEVLTLFIAGHETTALTLTWMFALLDKQPLVLTRMQAEVRDVLGGRDPSFADIPKLTYLRQVIDEVLRMRPPAAFVARNAVADDEIGGYRVYAGEVVLLFFWGTHRHAEYWSEPERFDPERFTPEQDKERNSWSYLPFSAGPRSCIGNMFSLTETVLLLAQLLNRFDVEVQPCAHVKPIAIATVRPSDTVRVVLKSKVTA